MATLRMSHRAPVLRLMVGTASKGTTMVHAFVRSAAAATPSLHPFTDQWAARLTTYRRDGRPVGTTVNIALLEDRLVFLTYAHAWKCRRLERDQRVRIAPSSFRGTPTGPEITGRARLLAGSEADRAARVIDAKYPIFQGLLVRLVHRLFRYRTVHFEILPDTADHHRPASPAPRRAIRCQDA